MWVYVFDEPIPTYGKHGETFLLHLNYQNYYGHNITATNNSETVVARWDSINEAFYETKTGKEIDNRDISEWWKDI